MKKFNIEDFQINFSFPPKENSEPRSVAITIGDLSEALFLQQRITEIINNFCILTSQMLTEEEKNRVDSFFYKELAEALKKSEEQKFNIS